MSVSQAARLADNPRVGRVRYGILAMLFTVTVVNYADPATLALAGPSMSRQFGLSPVSLGIVFSAFAWTYMLAKIPGGWPLDRYGSRMVYFVSIVAWSCFTLPQGGVQLLAATAVVPVLFVLRALVGLTEAPSFPVNSRIVVGFAPCGVQRAHQIN